MHASTKPRASQHNQLLAALSRASWDRIAPDLRRVDLLLGEVLFEPGEQPLRIYFPEDSIASLLYTLADGGSTELAIVGSDGMVGLSFLLSHSGTVSRAVVQSAGTALSISSGALQREFARGGALNDIVLRYAQALFVRTSQVAVCNRHHSIEQQLCRWILVSMDRLPINDLHMTQELMSNMLGVQRTGLTEVANRLRRRGIIRYARERIQVIDRARLEASCCECYGVVARESERLLPHIDAAPDWYT